MKRLAGVALIVTGGSYLATHQDKIKLPFLGHVATWEFKARRNGHLKTAKILSWYDNLGSR